MPSMVLAFVRGEEAERGRISSQTCSKFRGRGERRRAFSFAIASAIGSKSGPVERKKPKMRAGLLDGPPDVGLLVGARSDRSL
jgi:hypothetical protein